MTISEHDGGVAVIRFSNPPRGYLTAATSAGIDGAVAEALADAHIRVVILSGADTDAKEPVFIRHYSIPEIEAMADGVESGAITGTGPRAEVPVYRLIDRLLAAEKPVIAAINGTCMGGGFETALACTIRVAAAGDYMIGLPETRLGILPGAGGLQFLARLMGLSQATAFVLEGRAVSPVDALKLGLVHEVAEGPVLPAALALARRLQARPAAALAAVLRMHRALAAGEGLSDGLETAAREFLATLAPGSGARALLRRFHDVDENILA
jgi:enoyl-CoA hydratase